MKRRVQFGVLAVLVGVAGWLAWQQRPAARLRRQLDFWVHRHQRGESLTSQAERLEAMKAGLRALGTNGVPLLVGDLERRPGLPVRIRRWIRDNGPASLGRLVLPRRDPTEDCRAEAVLGLQVLGRDARLAEPALLRALEEDDNPRVRGEVIIALGAIGADGPGILSMLTSGTNDIPSHQLGPLFGIWLWRLQPTNAAVVELVCQATNPPVVLSDWCVWRAAEVLADLGPAAHDFTPWLQTMLRSQPSGKGPGGALGPYFPHQGRWRVARALWRIETNAEPALFTLRSFTNAAASPEWPAQIDPASELCRLVRELSEIPEFCAAVKPLLESMDVHGQENLTWLHSNALQRVERTLNAGNARRPAYR